MEPVAPGLRRPCDQLVDGGQRAAADGVAIGAHAVVKAAVDGDEPLRRVAVDDGGFGPPGMRIGVLQLALGKQRPGIGQLLDDRDIGRALLAIGQDDRLPAKQRQVSAVGAVGFDIVGHRQIEADAHLIIVVAMARRGMNKPGARIIGHMVAGEQGDRVVPFAVAAADAAEGMGTDHRPQIAFGHINQSAIHFGFKFRGQKNAGSKLVSHNVASADKGEALFRA